LDQSLVEPARLAGQSDAQLAQAPGDCGSANGDNEKAGQVLRCVVAPNIVLVFHGMTPVPDWAQGISRWRHAFFAFPPPGSSNS